MPKQGDIDAATGLAFWSRQASCANGERWITLEQFAARKLAIKSWRRSEAGGQSTRAARNTDAGRARRNAYAKRWRKTVEQRAVLANRARKRRATKPLACMADRIRARVREAFRVGGIGSRSSTRALIGCDWATLLLHIERQFSGGMTWENRSEWELDHRIPFSSAKTKADLIRIAHYTNLNPLWTGDNRRKGSSVSFK